MPISLKLSTVELQKLIPLIEQTKWSYRLDKFSDEAAKEVLKSAQRARDEITQQLQFQLPILGRRKERLEALSEELYHLSLAAQSQITGKIAQATEIAGADSYTEQNNILSFGGLVPHFNPVILSIAQLHSIVTEMLVGGRLLNEWVKKTFETNIQEGIKSEFLTGMLKGEGSKAMAKRFGDKIFDGVSTDVETLTKSYIQSVNVQAMNDVMKANSDIVKGKKWNSLVENNTCLACLALDSRDEVYPLDSGPEMPLHPRCFLSKNVPIYTSKGWKGIGEIKIGDLVLTHKNRFRKVYATPRSIYKNPDTVRFEFKKVKLAGFSITANHQIQVSKHGRFTRWKEAGDCKDGDHIMMMANRCQRCNKLIPYTQKYCGHKCVSLDITDKQWADPNHRKNMSQKASAQMNSEYASGARDKYKITKKANARNLELIKNGEHIFQQEETILANRLVINTPAHNKASSIRMKKKNPMYDPLVVAKVQKSLVVYREEHPEKHPNVIMAQKGFMSGIERKMKQILDNSKVEYVSQLPIHRPGKGYYYVDFAIPSLKIAIEVDGSYWHKNTEKDDIRQQDIEEQGWTVIRFNENRINNCLEEVEKEVIRVVCNHRGQYETFPYPVTSVTKRKLKRKCHLYNLSVEEDESYIARGVVVHNCRCFWEPITKTFREMGVDIDEAEKAYRPYAIRGKIDPTTGKVTLGKRGISSGRFLGTYEDFLKGQPEAIQRQILGPSRFELWQSGKVKLMDFADKNGNVYLLKELKGKVGGGLCSCKDD